MLRADGPPRDVKVDLEPGERVLARLDEARLGGVGDGTFFVTTAAAKFVSTGALASRALHGLGVGVGRGADGPTHAVTRAEIVAVERESTTLGWNRLRLRLRGGSEWLVELGARDPSDLLAALRPRPDAAR